MNPGSWQDLEKTFRPEIMIWFIEYPDKEFIERIVKRVFSYYDKPSNAERKPKDRDQWQRAIAKFLKDDWEKQQAQALPAKRAAAAANSNQQVMAKDDEIKAKLASMQGRGAKDCPKCLNLGTVGMYKKPSLSYYTFLCDCPAGDLAAKLTEHRARNIKTQHGETHIPRVRFISELNLDQWERDF